ncbi:unnamed protein product [Prorocentrum cordatum]|uniref:glutathione gamma-glutamylcysteinyltransferase n=1 Tax=Prorocentrum cordatum TaxID=2364126 RepID=A0ABN9W5A2_9DINO|nr:unnamed protein product [Polarella glacialis]
MLSERSRHGRGARYILQNRCISEIPDDLPFPSDVVPALAWLRSLLGLVPGLAGQFYQRALPSKQIAFGSPEGRRLFREALAAGNMENYFFLAEQFRTQDDPAFCGLATLAMVLNSLRIDPMRTWKGAWRWFNELNLGCCSSPSRVREEGLSFDMFGRLASCNGAGVTARRAPAAAEGPRSRRSFEEEFRATVRATSRSGERECLVVCYAREALGQTGVGHFSPIGGYHAETDRVLILDVASFKYPTHWAALSEVAEGMLRVDQQTGRPRGYLQLRAQPEGDGEGLRQQPLRVASVPRAAGRSLTRALAAALGGEPAGAAGAPPSAALPAARAQGLGGALGLSAAEAEGAVGRWLRAAAAAEPQVLRRLLQAGDGAQLREVMGRLWAAPAFAQLCHAYGRLTRAGASQGHDGPPAALRGFPPLLFGPGGGAAAPAAAGAAASGGLGSCGELWVLLLVLLPEHLRRRVSPALGGGDPGRALIQEVRGPWALPLECVREALAHALPPPARAGAGACGLPGGCGCASGRQ